MLDTIRVDLKKLRDPPKVKINSAQDVVNFVKEMEDYDREYFRLLALDVKNRIIAVENIAIGSLSAAIIHPREVLKGALLANAHAVILVHNHPSGVSQPSNEDDMVISKLRDAFNLMGITVMDGIIIAKEKGYYSYKEDMRLERMTEGGSQRIMELKVKENGDDACTVAMRAAMETMGKYCGEGATVIEIDGMKFTLPFEVLQIRENADLTYDQRVKAIQESKWGQNEARGLCAKLFGQETAECIERVSKKLAEGMVKKGS